MDERSIAARLRLQLGDQTFAHSVAVAERAAALAPAFGADGRAARLAGLLHDCAKGLPASRYVPLAEEAGLDVIDSERASPKILHQRLGAAWAASRYEVDDEAVLAAIACHTTGRAEMDELARCLIVADYTSDDRSFEGVTALREAAAADPWEGFRAVLEAKRELVRRRGLPEHPWAMEAYARWL